MNWLHPLSDVNTDDHGRVEYVFDAHCLKAFAAAITAESAAQVKEAIENVEEPAWYGYECPNTFQDGMSAAILTRAERQALVAYLIAHHTDPASYCQFPRA